MSKADAAKDMTFEDGLEKLESIVDEMENGDLPLDKLIERYEQGAKLLKHCDAKIKEAETKIEILKNKDGQLEVEDFDPDSE